VAAAPVIDFRNSFRFDAAPPAVWRTLEETGEFERWWAWLGDFHLDGPGLAVGSVLTGVVSPPLPYRMRVRVVIEESVSPSLIDTAVHGDLEGRARLELVPEGNGTLAGVTWRIEMMQAPMRVAAAVALPVLRWGHDRVVDATVAAFRRRLAVSERPGPTG
jgi:hypothetical protein